MFRRNRIFLGGVSGHGGIASKIAPIRPPQAEAIKGLILRQVQLRVVVALFSSLHCLKKKKKDAWPGEQGGILRKEAYLE